MKLASRLKVTATLASAGVYNMGAAAAKCRTLAQVIADGASDANAIKVGDTGVPFTVEDTAGNWEDGLYTITSGTQITRTSVVASSAGGTTAATFSGSLTAFNAASGAWLSKVLVSDDGQTIGQLTAVTAANLQGSTLLVADAGAVAIDALYAYLVNRMTAAGLFSGGGTSTPVDNAPTLSAISASATGSTTATGSVTTNETGGTLYWLYSTASTATAAQVKAGSSKTVTAAGAQTLAGTGLTAATSYYLHALHRDSASQDSAVLSLSTPFTTQAAAAGPTYQFNGPKFSGGMPTSLAFNGTDVSSPLSADFILANAAGVPTDPGNVDIYVSMSTSSSVPPRPNDSAHSPSPANTFRMVNRIGNVGDAAYAGCYAYSSLYTYKSYGGGLAPRFLHVVMHVSGADPATATPIWTGVYDGSHTGTPVAITMSA